MTAPSSIRQLALPIWLKLSRFLPSNRVTQPSAAEARCEIEKAANPTRSRATLKADQRFMMISSQIDYFFDARPSKVPRRFRSETTIAGGGPRRKPWRCSLNRRRAVDMEGLDGLQPPGLPLLALLLGPHDRLPVRRQD